MSNLTNVKPNISLADTKAIVCECGCVYWDDALLLREVSRLLSGANRDSLLPIPIFVCRSCGKALEKAFPTELIAKDGVTSGDGQRV